MADAGHTLPDKRLKKKIREAAVQIKMRRSGGAPGLLVLLDEASLTGYHTYGYTIMTAMYGPQVVSVPGGGVWALPEKTPVWVGNGRGVGEDSNRSISAIAALTQRLDTRQWLMSVYHNRFATVAFDPDILRRPVIQHYKISDEPFAGSGWVEIPAG
jgi:hypothetical protein